MAVRHKRLLTTAYAIPPESITRDVRVGNADSIKGKAMSVYLVHNGSRTLTVKSTRQGPKHYVHTKYKAKRIGHYRVYEAIVPNMGRPVWLVRGPSSVEAAAWNKRDAISLAIKLKEEDGNYVNVHYRYSPQSAVSVLSNEVLDVLTKQGY